ncbi:MAG: c-type cytochrome, partial [Pirellulaceae bacterium]
RLMARQLAASPSGAEALLKSIEQGKASARLLRQAAIRYSLQEAKVPGLKHRLEKLTDNLQSLDEKIAPLIRQRRQGFVVATTSQSRGKVLFQKHCAGCHRVTSDGAKIGPDLKAIGHRGLDRLLEDLLDPHRNVDPKFRRTTVVTTGGEILSGLLVRGKGTQRLLIDQQGKEVVLDEKEIDEAIVSPLSAMPSGLGGHLKAAEFHDLMAYLLSLQAIASPPQKPFKK